MLEVAANAVTAVSIFLAGRNSIHTWWTGIVACLLFGAVFFGVKLYADVTLQAFFVATSVSGWYQWQRGARGEPLPVANVAGSSLAWIVPAAAAASVGYGALLHHWTDAYAPFVDSAVLVLSIVAQLLLMQRRVEAWPFWLIVNSIAVPLYMTRGLYLTSALYAAYWINATVSWQRWRRLARNSNAELSSVALQ
jgi:nicotinamide mononucleotide transporter